MHPLELLLWVAVACGCVILASITVAVAAGALRAVSPRYRRTSSPTLQAVPKGPRS